jgi:DNA repair protein RecN (Recombination protein N)
MLQWIHIQNYVLIQELSIDFRTGLNIITGETGAGKSILLGALGLLSGTRAESDSLLNKTKKCTVEASFLLEDNFLKNELESIDIDYDEDCILRREIAPNGKSRAFINDTPVNLQQLKSIAALLVDIHSQHQTMLLNESWFRLNLVDEQAHHPGLINLYQTSYSEYQQLNQQLSKITAENKKLAAEQEYMQFQLDTLRNLPFTSADEQDELEAERDLLSHAAEIQQAYEAVEQNFENESHSAMSLIQHSISELQHIQLYSPAVRELKQRLESARIELQDILTEIRKNANHIEFNPGRLNQVNELIDLINTQLHKHKASHLSELLQIRTALEQSLLRINQNDEEELRLKKQVELKKSEMQTAAHQLSESRRKCLPGIEDEMTEMLKTLGIRQAKFKLEMTLLNQPVLSGQDEVRFLFSSTPLHAPQEVSKVASGGELSRIMLCLKGILARSSYKPTLIFDEIDTGVSGEIAHRFGKIIHQISQKSQVIAITHLPQVAALGDWHYRVFKSEDQSSTGIEQLSEAARVSEIARLISGENLNSSAMEHAENLLKK